MRYLELTLPSIAENLALDEALLDEAQASDTQAETLRIWQAHSPFVVLGRSSRFADEVQQKGTVDHTPVYVREVVKRALELGATAVILVHNHPSGDPTPSRADIDMTKLIVDAARPFNIAVHDHIIVGREGHASFRALRLL